MEAWGQPFTGQSPAVAWRLAANRSADDIQDTRGLHLIDGEVLLRYDSCDVVAIDARTGVPRWTVGTRTGGPAWHPFTKLDNQIVLSGTAFIDATSGRLVKERDRKEQYHLFGARGIRFVEGHVEVLDLRTGRRGRFDAPWADAPVPERITRKSDPVVVADTLYWFTQRTGAMHAIDLRRENVRWSLKASDHGLATISTPLERDGVLYACAEQVGSSRGGGLARIDAASGRLLSFVPMVDPDGISTQCGLLPPSPADGVVVLNNYNAVVQAFDIATGGLRWRSPVHALTGVTGDGDVVYALAETELRTLDAATGRLRHLEPEVPGDSNSPPALGPDGLVIVQGPSGILTAFRSAALR